MHSYLLTVSLYLSKKKCAPGKRLKKPKSEPQKLCV